MGYDIYLFCSQPWSIKKATLYDHNDKLNSQWNSDCFDTNQNGTFINVEIYELTATTFH